MTRPGCEIPLADTPCGSCGCEPAWLWSNSDVLCAECFHNGEKPNQVKAEIRKNIKKQRQHPEADFAKAFDELADLRGWTWCGFRPARQKIKGQETYRTALIGQKGLPDRILARRGVVLLVELKADDGILSEGQEIWGTALEGFVGYYVLRPTDWDAIVEILE